MTTAAERAGGVVPREYSSGGMFVRIGGRPGEIDAGPTDPFDLKIRQRDAPHHGVVATLHDKVPDVTNGGGGWEEIKLPRRRAVLVWKGGGLMKLALSVVFDGAGEVAIKSPAYKTLLHFWRPVDPTEEPSVLTLASPGDIVPYLDEIKEWVLENIELGDGEADAQGRRTQQILTLTFSEYRADERLQSAKAASQAKGKTQLVVVKADHESLSDIAREWNVKGGWKAIGDAQTPKITDPRATKRNQRLYIPVGDIRK